MILSTRIAVMTTVLFLMSACSGLPGMNPPAMNSSTKINVDTTVSGSADLNTCINGCSVLASGTGLLTKETCQDGCWAQEAENTQDVRGCSKVQNSLIQAGCVTNVAEKTGNVSDCDLLGSTEDLMVAGCYMNIAKVKNDVSICAKIKNSLIAAGCTSELQGN